jgi:hypothetical protein
VADREDPLFIQIAHRFKRLFVSGAADRSLFAQRGAQHEALDIPSIFCIAT